MSRVISGRVMPGGWNHIQKMPDGSEHVIIGGSLDGDDDGLYMNVTEFRVQNKIEVGNVFKDVDEQICLRYPQQCHAANSSSGFDKPVYYSPKGQRFIDKLATWGSNMLSNPLRQTMELGAEAQRRGKICSTCPRNIEWKNSCATCVTNASRLFAIIRGTRKVEISPMLKGCACYNHDNGTAIWLKQECFGSPENPAPGNCWVGKS